MQVMSQACADEWSHVAESHKGFHLPSHRVHANHCVRPVRTYGLGMPRSCAGKVLNVMVGGLKARRALLAVPLAKLAQRGGAAIQLFFRAGGQAVSVYRPVPVWLHCCICTLDKFGYST